MTELQRLVGHQLFGPNVRSGLAVDTRFNGVKCKDGHGAPVSVR